MCKIWKALPSCESSFWPFIFCTLQRLQRSCVRRPPLVTVDRCTLSVTTCPCCLPNLAHSTSTQKTRKTSRADSTDGLTTALTVTQVRPDTPPALPNSPMHHIMILQVRLKTPIHRVSCSAAKPAVWREEQSFFFQTDLWWLQLACILLIIDSCFEAVLQAQLHIVPTRRPRITTVSALDNIRKKD